MGLELLLRNKNSDEILGGEPSLFTWIFQKRCAVGSGEESSKFFAVMSTMSRFVKTLAFGLCFCSRSRIGTVRGGNFDKHATDKAEREANDDPNVEYIDMEDFKPGGKRGPKVSDALATAEAEQTAGSVDLRKAAEVVASMAPKNPAVEGLGLSSDLWSELI